MSENNGRDYGAEIDEIKAELRRLTELLTPAREEKPKEKQKNGYSELFSADPHASALMDECMQKLENDCGAVAYVGTFASGGNQSTWVSRGKTGNDLLGLIESGTASKVLACIGSIDRMRILMALLRRPMTVAEICESLSFGSTGQVYHHLKPLLAADIVGDEVTGERGKYCVVPHRVQGIIMLLAGISDLIDTEYGAGIYE